jgi:hypothetical protein
VLKRWLAHKFEFLPTHKLDLSIWINHSLREGLDQSLTKRGFGRVSKAQKCIGEPTELAALKGEGLEVFIATLKN